MKAVRSTTFPDRALLGEIKERIRSAQNAALRAVNLDLLSLYWDIGRPHRSTPAARDLGTAVVENLAEGSSCLQFPGVGGLCYNFSRWRIKQFYEAYSPATEKTSHHWCEKLAGPRIW